MLVIVHEQRKGIADLFTSYVKETAPLKITQSYGLVLWLHNKTKYSSEESRIHKLIRKPEPNPPLLGKYFCVNLCIVIHYYLMPLYIDSGRTHI